MRLERWLYTVPLRLRSLMRRRDVERDLDDELRYHLESEIDAEVAKGLSRDAAARLAARRFGGIDQIKERCRDARGLSVWEDFVQDIRYGARALRRDPGFAAVAILTLAIGIGGNSAVFSLVDGILLSRLPYPEPDRLVSVTGTYPNGAFAAMRDEVGTLDVAAYAEGHAFTLTGAGEPTRLAGTLVSVELFPLLGVQPAAGRWLRAGEDVAPRDHVVVLSHGLWQSRFHGDPTVVGRFIELDGIDREVIAVMPPTFRFPSVRTEVWVPLGLDSSDTVRTWAGDFMPVVGRLQPGATMGQAHAEIRVFQSRVPSRFPWTMPDDWNRDVTVIPLQEALIGDLGPTLLMLLGAVALVLMIACANVTNLGLSKAMAREQEIGIRAAIGAGPRRIARQLLTESVLLSCLGAAVGLLFAAQILALLRLVLPPDTPRLAEVQLSWRVLAFTGALALATGCMAGVIPAAQALQLRLRTVLQSGGRGARVTVAGPFRAALTIAQIASAVLLVITAGLLVRSLWSLTRTDPGFERHQLVTARLSPSDALCDTPERCLAFYRALEDRLQAVPGVRSAGFVNTLPLTGSVAKRSVELEGYKLPDSATAPLFWLTTISPDYLRTMGISVQSGRAFTRADLSGDAAVAMVTSSTARRYWPGRNPVGQHVRFIGEDGWRTIVGVVADVRAFDLTRSEPEWMDGTLYVPHGPNATMEDGHMPTSMTLVLRTSLEGAQVSAAVTRLAADLSRDVVVSDVKSMDTVLADSVAAPAATTSLLVTMAALALVLGSVGVYGVLSFLVSSRKRDVGIRLALGAQRADVFWLVMKEGATLCATGVALGVAGAIATSRWISSELHGVEATDPATYAAVVALVSLVTLTACYVPTRRAMAVDPLIVLRDP